MIVKINKIEINLNLNKEYKIIVLSDTHAISPNEEISIRKDKEEQWLKNRIYFANKFHEDYDSSNNIETYKCLDYLIDNTNKLDCDLLLLNGDIIDFLSVANNLFLSSVLDKIEHNYLYIQGNHDKIKENYSDINIKEFSEFLIFGVNNSQKSFTKEMISALKSCLQKNKPIIIACHIPINYNNGQLSSLPDYYYIDYNTCDLVTKEFIDLVLNNKLINLVLSSHVHGFLNLDLNSNTKLVTSSSGLIGSINEIIIK